MWPNDTNPAPERVSLESLDKKITQLLKAVVAPEALGDTPPSTLGGRAASTPGEAVDNARVGLDADGYPHRFSGQHAGSTEDWQAHVDANPSGVPFYANWKDPNLAIVLLSQSNGIKTPAGVSTLGFFATVYAETIKNNEWQTMTVAEWFKNVRSTNGQGGASGNSA